MVNDILKNDVVEKENMAGIYNGWLKFWNRNFERWLYTLHRITGVGVGLYLVVHIWETSNAAQALLDLRGGGSSVLWTNLMELFMNQLFHTGLLLVALAAIFHSLNGVRLVLAEQGWLIGKVKRPTYPFKASSLTGPQRYIGVMLTVVAFVLTLYAFYELFIVALGGW